MKRVSVAVALVIALGPFAQPVAVGQFEEPTRLAWGAVGQRIEQELRDLDLDPGATLSLLPLLGDQGDFIQGLVKRAVTAAGLSYVEGISDPAWTSIVAEVAELDRKGQSGIMDSRTTPSIGGFKAASHLLYGIVRDVSESADRVLVELELHLTRVMDAEHLWGDVFSHRMYLDEADSLAPETLMREVLRAGFRDSAIPKRSGLATVLVVPLAGDPGGYVTDLAVELLSRSGYEPRRPGSASLWEARALAADPKTGADGILVGSVRDLSGKLEVDLAVARRYRIDTETQLRIEQAGTGNIAWADTIATTQPRWAFYIGPQPVIWVVGVVLVLFVFRMFLRATTRPR